MKKIWLIICIIGLGLAQLACKTNPDGTLDTGDFHTGFPILVIIVGCFVFCLFLVAVPALMKRGN